MFLEDKETSTFQELTSVDAIYSVTLQDNIEGIGRFYLHTKPSTLSNEDIIGFAEVEIFTTDQNNLRILGIHNETAKVTLYNLLGVELYTNKFEGEGQNDMRLPFLKAGIYIVHLKNAKGRMTKKIFIE